MLSPASWGPGCATMTGIIGGLILVLFSGFLPESLLTDHAVCRATHQSVCLDKCIPIQWLCDGEKHCPDGSDEQCDKPCNGDENAWQCANGKCIPEAWKCDGAADCLDGSDELDCACTGNKIQCHLSGECIDRSAICDGDEDSGDALDEMNGFTNACMENQVQCKNKVCIMKSWLCDGVNNCRDGSDEDGCDFCEGFYKCGDGTCLNTTQVCNGIIDCPDGSDEKSSCGNCSVSNGGCKQNCNKTTWGVSCSCKEGWKLQPDGQSCIDIDECSLDYSPCHQLCSNSEGAFTCDCVQGFKLKGKTVCEVSGMSPAILLAKNGEIGVVNIRTGDYQYLPSIHGQPTVVTYYLSKEAYIWIEENKSIKMFVTGSKSFTPLYPDVKDVSSLSVDWLTGQLYWASKEQEVISVGLLDSRGYINLLQKDVAPDQLIVFPVNRYMYWINYGEDNITSLQTAGMDGSDRHVIASIPMEQPVGLTLDHFASRLYWVSKYKESIETVRLDGSGRFTFPDVLQNVKNILGFEVFEEWFFLADEKRLLSLSRNNPAERQLLLNTINISAFTVLHDLQQLPNNSPCFPENCSHICLLSPVLATSFKCVCPVGLFLLPSGKCENLQMMYSTSTGIYLKEFGSQGIFLKKAVIHQAANINLMDVDWKRDLIYWTDEHGLLMRSNGALENINVFHTGGAVCMAKVDIPTGNIYWIPCKRNEICLTKLSGLGTKVIYRSKYTLHHLLINWEAMLLYVVEGGMGLQQISLDGQDVQNVLNGSGFTNMSLDRKSQSILWRSQDFGFYSFSVLKKRLSQLKDNFPSTLMDAFEPYIFAYNNSVIEIWDRKTMKLFSSVKEANVTNVILVTLSHVKGSSSACELNNGGCMPKEICISGPKNSVSCLCPDDQGSCFNGDVWIENPPFPEITCPRTFILCRDGKDCVSLEFVCDGESDCLDGSDEEDCSTFCNDEGHFQCLNSTKCIEKKYYCDGVPQCPDGSDEKNCWKPTETCAISCDKPSRCIPLSWICDGKADCTDGSDERGCERRKCSANKFQCNDGECIPYAMRCDGDNDCNDHSDEQNCTVSKPVRCRTEDFKCQSGECILKEWQCDGAKDCKDGSDEKDCNVQIVTCESNQWPCASEDQCIPSFWRCDGSKDCRDGSDENQCDLLKCKNMFKCANFDCIPTSIVCDGKPDCPDGSDEGGKCDAPCQCPLACYRTPYGPKCMCDMGFRLSSDKSLCIDINECKELDPSPCSQSCFNQNGTYKCLCHPGYALETDGHQCKVTGTEPVLLVAVGFSLILYKLRTAEEEILTSTDKSFLIFSIDYDILEQRVFWMDLNAESIKWMAMGTKAKGTLVKGIKTDCIAVDWIGRNLYWTDGTAGQILATPVNTTWRGFPEYVVVLDEYLDQPRSLVLEPFSGLMYWTDIGGQPQIQQAGMDGSQRKILITEKLGWPTGLALDSVSWKIFWSDDKLHSIGSANLDGTNIKVIQINTIRSPFALTVFEDDVYWSEMKSRTVQKMNKRTGKNMSVLIKRHGQPYGLKVIHEVLQPRTENPCLRFKCSHVCLIGPMSQGSCRCPTGLLLSTNMLDCVSFKNLPFLAVALPEAVFQIYLHKLKMDEESVVTKNEVVTLTNTNTLSSIDLILKDRTLFFAVKGGGYIASVKVTNGDSKAWKKIMHVEDSVLSIAVDWITGNIFWVSTFKPLIQVATSNGLYTTVVVEDLNQPSSIVVYPTKGIMCYSDAGSESPKILSKIECAAMDGKERKILWRKGKSIVGLTFGETGADLYWADRESGTIESISVDGSNYKVLQSRLRDLHLFTAGYNFLFWTVIGNGTTKVFYTRMNSEIKFFEVEHVVDLKVYGGLNQQGSNGCSANNGGCSQICLPNPIGRTCHCSSTHQLVNGTYCLEPLKCPTGSQPCKDGLKCVYSNKICDGKPDCLDASDEKSCAYLKNKPSFTDRSTKPTDIHLGYPRLHSTEGKMPPKIKATTVETPTDDKALVGLERNMESRPCTRETCSMRGECILENDVIKCQCDLGYSGMSCEDSLQPLAVPLTVGTLVVLLVIGIVVGGFVYMSRRRALQRTSSSASSRTLTRQSAKDSDSLEIKHVECTETFLNSAFDSEGNAEGNDAE